MECASDGENFSTAAWTDYISTVLKEHIGKNLFLYIDDMVIYAETLEKHNEILKNIMEDLWKNGIELNMKKLEILPKKLEILGHEVEGNKVTLSAKTKKKIQEINTPKNKKGLERLLGFLNWVAHKTVGFAQASRILYSRLKGTFFWDEEAQKALEKIKESVVEELTLPKDGPFAMYTDASDECISALLFQDGNLVGIHSKALKSHQLLWGSTEKEWLAIEEGLKKFRPYIGGNHVEVRTDNAALCWTTMTEFNNRILKSMVKTAGFKFNISWLPGVLNVAADFMSRPVENGQKEFEINSFIPEGLEKIMKDGKEKFLLHGEEEEKKNNQGGS